MSKLTDKNLFFLIKNSFIKNYKITFLEIRRENKMVRPIQGTRIRDNVDALADKN